MPNPDEPAGISLVDGLRPFRNQSRLVHAVAVAVGVLTWVGTYVAVMKATGWDAVAAAETVEAIHARRNAAAVASLACGAYFGLLWIKAVGGPLLNFLYPVAIVVLMPDRVFALFETPPAQVYAATSYSGLLNEFGWYWDTAIVGVPLFVGLLIPLYYWNRYVLTDRQKREFADRHVPEAWRSNRP